MAGCETERLWEELHGLLPAACLSRLAGRMLKRSSVFYPDMLSNLVAFAKVVEPRRIDSCEVSGDKACSVAFDAFWRGGTASLFTRALMDMDADWFVNCWAADNLQTRKPNFAYGLRARKEQFKAHEWLHVRDCMRSFEERGVFTSDKSLKEYRAVCAGDVREYRSRLECLQERLVDTHTRTFRIVLDDDSKHSVRQWVSGRIAIPLSAYVIMKAVALEHISDKEAYLLDYELLQDRYLSAAGKKLWRLMLQ